MSDVLTKSQNLAASIVAKRGDARFKQILKDKNNDCFIFEYEGGPAIVNFAHFDGFTV